MHTVVSCTLLPELAESSCYRRLSHSPPETAAPCPQGQAVSDRQLSARDVGRSLSLSASHAGRPLLSPRAPCAAPVPRGLRAPTCPHMRRAVLTLLSRAALQGSCWGSGPGRTRRGRARSVRQRRSFWAHSSSDSSAPARSLRPLALVPGLVLVLVLVVGSGSPPGAAIVG